MWWRIAHAIVVLLCCYCTIISVNGFLIGNGNNIRYIGQSYEKNMRVYTTRIATKEESIRLPSSLSDDSAEDDMVYTRANIDYSAANEYIRAHYNHSSYFATSTQDGASSIVEHEIYNGRVLQSSKYDNNAKEMLIDNGLAIIQSPLLPNDSIDWSNMNDIQSTYLPKLEHILHNLFPTTISSYCFWNPMLRGIELEMSRTENGLDDIPTANIASLVHIDTDVGAYESIEDLINIVDKNKVESPTQSKSNEFNKEDVANDIIQNNKRFAIINFWRNIDEEPISNSPLAILSSRYENETIAFPNQQPDMNKSKWYTFPYATHDEVIVFYQYDRNVQQPSDLWHCAISTPPATESTSPRRSFDIRAFVLLDECVPNELDRFSSDRTRPILNFEESGCFCNAQAEKREREKSSD